MTRGACGKTSPTRQPRIFFPVLLYPLSPIFFLFISLLDNMSNMSIADTTWDVIVIGSGIGGLTAAALLARYGWKVLLLEQHFELGGFTHSFRRTGGLDFDVGLHYIGEMGEGQLLRLIFDLVTGGKVSWTASKHIYERFVFPNLTLEVPNGADAYENKLKMLYSDDSVGIKQYFRAVRLARLFLNVQLGQKGLPYWAQFAFAPLIGILKPLALTNLQEFLEKHIKSEQLRTVLAAQSLDHLMAPRECPLLTHAAVVSHFLDGAYYPKGGASVIAQAAMSIVNTHGGRCLTSHLVKKVLIENNHAVGVTVWTYKMRIFLFICTLDAAYACTRHPPRRNTNSCISNSVICVPLFI